MELQSMSNTIQAHKTPSRLSALDGLRGYAALIVVFFHSILEIKPTIIDEILKKPIYALNNANDICTKIFLILLNGHAAVVLFFVLSGAVLMRSLQKNLEPSKTKLLLKFSIQRVFRIYPALIVCLIGVYCLSNYLSESFAHIFHDYFSIGQFWQNSFLFNTKLHGASWTLQVEIIAVPFVCLTFFLLKSKDSRYFWVFLILTLLYGIVFARYYSIGLICFILGFALITPKVSRFFSSLNPALFIIFLILTLAIKHFFPEEETSIIKGIRWFLQSIVVFGLVGLVYHNHQGIFIKCLNHPISQFLGRVSYSLYLFNVVGLHALIAATQHYFPQWCAQNSLIAGLCVGMILSLATLPIAHLSYEYIEKPGIKLGKWLIKNSTIHFNSWLIRSFKGSKQIS